MSLEAAAAHHQRAVTLQPRVHAHTAAMISSLCVGDWLEAEAYRLRAVSTFEAFLDELAEAHKEAACG